MVCGVKIYENKPFKNSGHAKQNLQGTYKIMNAPAKVLPTVRSLSALFWCLVDEIFFGPLFLLEVGLRAIHITHRKVFTGSALHAYLLIGGSGVIPAP